MPSICSNEILLPSQWSKFLSVSMYLMCQDRIEISIVFDVEIKTFLSNSQSYGLL